MAVCRIEAIASMSARSSSAVTDGREGEVQLGPFQNDPILATRMDRHDLSVPSVGRYAFLFFSIGRRHPPREPIRFGSGAFRRVLNWEVAEAKSLWGVF
jgi:hypothetical protein